MTLPRRARCSRVYPQAVVADKAFDADHLRQSIAQRGAQAVIPPRSNRNAPAFYFKHGGFNDQVQKVKRDAV